MRKIAKKLLSVMLVLSICLSTVWSCLLVSAATTDTTYTIVGDNVAAGAKTTTMTVTITDPDGISSGSFDLMLGKDVIDDANFGTKVNDEGETVPDYDNYLSSANSFTLEDLVGTKTVTPTFTGEYKKTSTATVWGTSTPAGTSDTKWEQTSSEAKTVVSDSPTETAYYVEAPSPLESDAYIWKTTGNTKLSDSVVATAYYTTAPSPLNTAVDLTTYVGTYYKATGNTINETDTSQVLEEDYYSDYNTPSPESGDGYQWIKYPEDTSAWMGFITTYKWKKHPIITKTEYEEHKVVTTHEYGKYAKSVQYEYQEYAKVYEDVITYGESKLDTDGNNMIADVNFYKEVDVYDEDGNYTGTTTVVDTEKSYKEDTGNKGTLLPNAFDNTNGLFDTKIEITGGTLANGTVVDESNINSYFTNSEYGALTGTTTNAVVGEMTDGRQYAYNMTDDYYTAHSGALNRDESTNNIAIDKQMLHRYYREYTTIDVATENLGYSISTVSEDTVNQTHSYAQYAQGFKNITFNASEAFSSITFTVTFDFSGICDRISANDAINGGDSTNPVTPTPEYKDGKTDGRWGTENYVGYGKKYELNLLNDTIDGVADTLNTTESGENNFFHVHDGHISEETGMADPYNIDAIKAAGLEKADNKTYFNLYNAKCNTCGRVTPMLAATDLPYKQTVINDDGTKSYVTAEKGLHSFNNYRNLSGISLTYQNDGSVSLNIHYPSSMEGEQFIITDENGKVLKYSDVIEGNSGDDKTSIYTAADSFYKSERPDENKQKYEGVLMSNTKMITIEGLSAADVDKTLYIARYTPVSSTETQLMSITHAISISDYCQAVIKDENVYYLNDNGSISRLDDDHAADKKIAAALINYAAAAKTALSTPNDTPNVIEVWNGKTEAMSLSEAGTKDDPYIVENAEQLAWLVSEATPYQTHQKYFKVKSDIQSIVLQKSGKNDIMALGSSDEVEAYFTNEENSITQWKTNDGTNTLFCGHFDGSGATIYGMSVSNGALFSNVGIGASIKNVAVENSYCTVSGANSASMVIGRVNAYEYDGETLANTSTYEDTNGDGVKDAWVNSIYEKGYTNLGNIKIANCKIVCNNTNYDRQDTVGLLMGYGGDYTPAYIVNCLVYGNEIEYTGKFTGINTVLIGFLANDNPAVSYGLTGCYIKNSLLLDTELVTSTNTNNDIYNAAGYTDVYTNISTSADTITVNNTWGGTATRTVISTSRVATDGGLMIIDSDDALGSDAMTNLSELDWVNAFMCGDDGEYPSLYHPDYKADIEGKTIFWSGSYDSDTNLTDEEHEYSIQDGTKENPIIIDSAEELAYIALNKGGSNTATSGKYYKIANDISKIILQPESIASADTDANGVYDILEVENVTEAQAVFAQIIANNSSALKQWTVTADAENYFNGNFDGNGVEIYGLYSSGNKNVGLFPAVEPYAAETTGYTYTRSNGTTYTQNHDDNFDEGSTIKNVTLKNSYMSSTNRIGGIVGVTPSQSYGRSIDSVIKIENCAVINCYMTSTGAVGASGVIIGSMGGGDLFEINNCLVYGNLATNKDGNDMTLFGYAPTSYNVVDENGKGVEANLKENSVKNTLSLGADPYCTHNANSRGCTAPVFKNVYTDSSTKVTFENWGGVSGKVFDISYSGEYITHVEAEDLYGVGAKLAMPMLDWYDISTNPDGVWYYGHYTDVPNIKEISNNLRAEDQAEYDAITFTPYTYGYSETLENGTMAYGVYATALSLKANPYMSFAFAFYGDYKTSRDLINIRFTYTVNGVTTTTEPISPPKYVEGEEIRNVDGWTNTKNNGRYHTYKLTDIPVEAMANGVKVEASYADSEYKDLGTFSASGLGYEFVQSNKVTPSKYYTTRIEAVKALMFYAEAIHERYKAR